jgi:RAB protein geranylgeranyltransferase component A
MITRADLAATKMRFIAHIDGSDFYQNHFANVTYPKLVCIVTRPRRRNSKTVCSKRFFFDGQEVFGCHELLELINAPTATKGAEAA